DFATDGGWERFSEFVESKGYAAVMFPGSCEFEADYLASGTTERGTSHMVVMNDGKPVHDPHPSNAGLVEVQCVWLLAKRATPRAVHADEQAAFEAVAKADTSNVSFIRDDTGYVDMTAALLWHGWKLRASHGQAPAGESLRTLKSNTAQAAPAAPWPIAPDVAAELERSDWTPEEALRWYAAGRHYDTVPNGDGSSSARILDNGAVASNALKSLSREYAERKGDVALQESPAAAQEPVYQASYKGGFWQDSSRERYEYLRNPSNSLAKDWELRVLYTHPAPQQAAPAPEADELIAKEDWIESAMRVYRIAGDTDDQARECAEYLWGELDMDDLPDPYDAAMEDCEGRGPAPQQAAPAEGDVLTQAAHDVLAERQRQISAEGWTPKHDDEHRTGAMASAAGCYALHAAASAATSQYWRDRLETSVIEVWPWDDEWFKPGTARRNLVKAGALILAELERIDRAAMAAQEKQS
ncbi:MAG: hypothetical protein RBT75_20465, partial [Anaerolineae bacterium]|nr:hypothetical protein [Anaerolineae bacterium]